MEPVDSRSKAGRRADEEAGRTLADMCPDDAVEEVPGPDMVHYSCPDNAELGMAGLDSLVPGRMAVVRTDWTAALAGTKGRA